MKNFKNESQLNLFGNFECPGISNEELIKFTQSNRSKTSDLNGAINRMIRAKRYHEIANKLATELLEIRIENEKLKEKIKIMEGVS